MFDDLDISAGPPPKGEVPSLRGGGGEPPAVPVDSAHASPSSSQSLSSALELLLLAAARARLTLITTLEKQLPTLEDPIELRRAAAILLRATSTPLIPIRKDPTTGLYEALQRAPRSESRADSTARPASPRSTPPSVSLRPAPSSSAISPSPAPVTPPPSDVPQPKPPRATPTFVPNPALEPWHIVQAITDAFRVPDVTQPDTGFVTLAAFIDDNATIGRDTFRDSYALRDPASSEANFELHLRHVRGDVGRNALDVMNDNTGSRPIASASITGDTTIVRQEITSNQVVRNFDFTLLRRPDSRVPNAYLITDIQWARLKPWTHPDTS